jgi:hypothetical protein
MRGRLWVVAFASAAAMALASAWILWWFTRRDSGFGLDQPAIISVVVNFDMRADVASGTPLFFEISLIGRRDRQAIRVGTANRPWHSLVHLVRAGSDEPLSWPVVRIGQPVTTYTQRAEGKPKPRVERSGEVSLEPDRTSRLLLAVAPEFMAQVAQGRYDLEAVLERELWPPWRRHGGVRSMPVTIVISADRTERRERERLALSAQYYLAVKRAEDALRAASDLVRRDPKNVAAAMLLGDALDALGRPAEALAAYRSALANSRRTYEPPVLVDDRIASVSRRLARSPARSR